MTELYKCKSCGESFRGDKIKSCPKCDTPVGFDRLEATLTTKSRRSKTMKIEALESANTATAADTLSSLVEAQKKTTFAVIAIAELLMMVLITSTVAGFLWSIAVVTGAIFFSFLAGLAILLGYPFSIYLGFQNLKKAQ